MVALLLEGASALTVASALKMLVRILTAPLWFFDAVDKEAMVLAIPYGVRRTLLKVMFWPTLFWTLLLHRLMPDQRRWYDRVDNRVIIGASARRLVWPSWPSLSIALPVWVPSRVQAHCRCRSSSGRCRRSSA